MITVNGVTYPSEVRASAAPPPQPDQEVPAGSSEPPGMSAVFAHGQTVVEGNVVHTDEPGPGGSLDGSLIGGGGVGGFGSRSLAAGQVSPILLEPHAHAAGTEGRTGLVGDPSGAGAPLRAPGTVPDPGAGQTYANPNAPTVTADPPVAPDEAEAARAMLEEAQALYGAVQVVKFVRYPTERRLMVTFEEGTTPGEVRGLQRAY